MDYRLEQFRFELREDPSSRVFFKLGEYLRREGELQEAIEVLSGGLEHYPKYVAAWVSFGRALLDSGNPRRAADALNRALALDPENAVASRHAGEAAIANGEWVEAIKAFKRTRAMSGPDDVLDERIQFVESHLAEMGLLEAPAAPPDAVVITPPAPGESPDQVFADTDEDPVSASAGDDVFVVDSSEDVDEDHLPSPEDNGRATMAVPVAQMLLPEGDVVSFADVSIDDADAADDAADEDAADDDDASDEDDDAADDAADDDAADGDDASDEDDDAADDDDASDEDADAADDAADDDAADDDDASDEDADAADDAADAADDAADAADDAADAADAASEPVFEIDAGVDVAADIDLEGAGEADLESATQPLSVPEVVTTPADEPEFDFQDGADVDAHSEDIPLPTMTLARLALDQGDLELAEKTLRGVLEREPNHVEAVELLAGFTSRTGVDDVDDWVADETGDARSRALRRWLEAVRLASERLKP